MNVRFTKTLAEGIGYSKLKKYGISEDKFWGNRKVNFNLAHLDETGLKEFEAVIEGGKGVRGIGSIRRDVLTWRELQKGSDKVKAKSVKQFFEILVRYVAKSPGHRVFISTEDGPLCYYVNEIEFHEEERRRDYVIPANVTMDLLYMEFGEEKLRVLRFAPTDCVRKTAREALEDDNCMIETSEMRKAYLVTKKWWKEIAKDVGRQLLASGHGDVDLDGNEDDDEYGGFNKVDKRISLAHDGEPSKVVVDVYSEKDNDDDEKNKSRVELAFWERVAAGRHADEKDDDEDGDLEIGENRIKIPTHPFVAVFDLKKHLRLSVHADNLESYEYDTEMSEKLVLEDRLKNLVEMLVEHRGGGFQDIVKGKGSGAVVLLTGKPGVGKTLTAEVYAESKKRALYSVQCSQLGVNAHTLEKRLMKTFARANRWNAVLLLDEADVYVRERESDLQQNAIVGVFLRVLEYQSSVMFLTTNRPDSVDDAIASRCIARLHYEVPKPPELKRIWEVLSKKSGAKVSTKTIDKVVEQHPSLSGRDVKNLLKLAMLVEKEGDITSKTIGYVKQFLPTKVERGVAA